MYNEVLVLRGDLEYISYLHFIFQSMIEAHDNFAQEGQTEVCLLLYFSGNLMHTTSLETGCYSNLVICGEN